VTRKDDQLFDTGEVSVVSVKPRLAAGRVKTFRVYDPAQQFLLPPSIDEWLPQDHPARFVGEAVDHLLDLSLIYASYDSAEGAPPYDPAMMLKVLLWGYSSGVTSAREMERRCVTDVAFRFLTANQTPDYRSIARFRRRHLPAISGLFTQVLVVCQQAGLVKLGRVALDGTKVKANASRHKAMSYEYLGPRIEQIQAEVDRLLAQGEQVDQAEDAQYGVDHRGDELPTELARRETRLVKMRAAKAAIEQAARDKAQAEAAKKALAKAKDHGVDLDQARSVADLAGAAARHSATPKKTDQRNFTDPDARIMKTSDGSFYYAYNGQAIVDEAFQVILATSLTQAATDVNQLTTMGEIMETQLDAAGITSRPRVVLADAGYCCQDNLEYAHGLTTDVLIATGRLTHGERVPEAPRGRIRKDATLRERMARRLRTVKGKKDYARRKAIVEPVFGQIKTRQNAGRFRLRGLDGATAEFTLHALVHNLRKLANTGIRPAVMMA